ncbi:MAG: tetratricopeptide repeat protein [Magnetococcus sp. DMHC-8]
MSTIRWSWPGGRRWRWLVGLPMLLLLACAGGGAREGDDRAFQMWFDKGRAYLERGNAQMALPALQQANRLQPDHGEVLALLGLAYDQMDRPVQALEALEEAHRLRPRETRWLNNLGVARLRVHAVSCAEREAPGCQRLLEQAEEALQSALQVSDLRAPEGVWFNLALVYKQRGQTDRMVAALEKALALSGQHLPARLELAEHYRVTGRPELARQHLRGALAAHPDQVVVLEQLVDTFFVARRQGEAGQSGAVALAGMLSSGERGELRSWLSRILALSPGTEAARRAAQRLLLLGRQE